MNKFANHTDLRTETLKQFETTNRMLADSPISRAAQISRIVGFYMGYCAAMDWDPESAVYMIAWDTVASL